jgi:small subunit ribosomal protein S2
MTEETLLVPTKIYLKSGIHIGTKFKTKYMEQFIYKTRPDGLSVLNLQKIDERLRVVANFMAQYAPQDILIASRRENGWKAANMFGKLTGCRIYAGRYPPGILTNPQLHAFIQVKLVFVIDTWPDRNVVKDALQVGVPVIALCDTNNQANNIDVVLPCNNKGKKSIGMVFYILAREYMLKRGMIKDPSEFTAVYEDFADE